MTFTPHTIDPTLDLELVRDVPVSPAAVFAAWTDPESLKQWFVPRPYSVPVAEIDLTVGGTRRVCMQMDTPNGQMQMWFIGEHTTIDPTTTLSYTESMSDPDGRILTAEEMGMPGGDMPTTTEVTVTITPADDGVHVSLVHAGVPAGSPGEQGWAMALEKLAAAVA